MSASPRTSKPRKGPEPGASATRGRGVAWRGGPGAGGAFAPNPGRQFGPAAFPPLAPAAHQLSSLLNSPVLLTTRTNQRLEGVLAAVTAEDGTPGAVLHNVSNSAAAGGPLQEPMFIPAPNIASCIPAQAPGAFRTDGDISSANPAPNPRPAWSSPPPPAANSGHVDDLTFGAGASSGQPWDQFEANKQMFGVVTTFDENVYTTALDRSAPGYEEKERKAEMIAKEIMAGSTNNNPHLAEERGIVDDSGTNEEDKYSSVVRGQNAYIPPARRVGQTNGSAPSPAPVTAKISSAPTATAKSPPPNASTPPANATATTPTVAEPKPDVPKLAINGTESTAGTPSKSGDNNLVGSFREFVTNEKVRLAQKKQAIVKSEKEKRMAELVAFSHNFKLNKPIPKDLVPILTKDAEKAKAIVEKSSQDAASVRARNIGGAAAAVNTNINPSPSPSAAPSVPGAAAAKKGAPASGTKVPKMIIQAIPPFNPNKSRGAAAPETGAKKDPAPGRDGPTLTVKPPAASSKKDEPEPSPTSAAFRLNVNASSFQPVHRSSSSVSAAPTPSPKAKSATETPATLNPFYGAKTFKKSQMTMLKEEFNPFKFTKVADAATVPSNWPYTGRRFMLLFSSPTTAPQPHQTPVPPPAPQPQPNPSQQPPPPQQPPPGSHPAHPPPPPMQQPTPPVPGPYDEEHARQYMQMYPYGYPYPGQPPMQTMMSVSPGPPPPPGYMQSPYMQPMPYPQHQMPPNQGMYGAPMPPMSHIPYMPPPGAYPTGAAPRGAMPPPHGYYHQSPQLGHAVPYPMMMQGPPGAPTPHPYDQQGPPNGPPGPLGVNH